MTIIRKLGLLLALFLYGNLVFSQAAKRPYFQQKVDYLIQVSLDDKKHQLSAFEEIVYTNNARVPLDSIFFHIWPNAYKDNSTAMSKQLLQNGNTDFYFSDESEKGYIDSLNFKVEGKKADWYYHPDHQDICIVKLPKRLAPGNSIIITTPFKVQLPGDFSRMGHDGESYQVTQWYPKPAVFDRDGWHAMPYLDQGEFYSEYGTFNVSITLPKNYVVGATGDLQNAEERKWLLDKVAQTESKMSFDQDDESFPESDKEFKTLTYYQKDVHDFAWFADKRYHVLRGEVQLPNSSDSVETWLMFTNKNAHLWKDAVPYMNQAIYAYSLWNGNYPYKQATAVFGALSAGGGMEYPNVTVIGETSKPGELETVLVHEVGHNWFQGILGFNERDQPAMDEGINSFNELRYIEEYRKDYSLVNDYMGPVLAKWMNMDQFNHRNENELFYLMQARKNIDQPLNLKSQEYTSANYGAVVYAKKALSVQMLRSYLGDTVFDKCMHQFYDDWKFKHPSLQDWRNTMEEVSGKDLRWFYNSYYQTTKRIDLKVKKVKQHGDSLEIRVKNKGDLGAPFSVSTFANGKEVGRYAYNGIVYDDASITIPTQGATTVVVDGEKSLVEHDRRNNTSKTKGLFKKMEPLQVKLLTSSENPDKSQLFLLPLMGWNTADEFMLGLGVHNKTIIEKPFEWFLGPMYSFHNEQLNGIADLSWHFYSTGYQRMTANINVMKFAYDVPANGHVNFVRYSPKIIFELKPRRGRSIARHKINVGALHLEESYQGESLTFLEATNTFGQVGYEANLNGTLHSLRAKVNMTIHEDFDMADYTLHYRYRYNKRKNQISARLFVGHFLYNESNNPLYNLRMDGQTGYLDYQKNQVFLDRAGTHDVWRNQMNENHGAFKSPTAVGQSADWLAALNIKMEAPLVVPVGVYADFGVAENTEMVFNAGFSFRIWRDICEVYFPVVWSQNILDYYDVNDIDYGQRIRFTLNLPAADPYKSMQNIGL
ncbi:unnamed protein product [Discosporangium mesarthrocarpum]